MEENPVTALERVTMEEIIVNLLPIIREEVRKQIKLNGRAPVRKAKKTKAKDHVEREELKLGLVSKEPVEALRLLAYIAMRLGDHNLIKELQKGVSAFKKAGKQDGNEKKKSLHKYLGYVSKAACTLSRLLDPGFGITGRYQTYFRKYLEDYKTGKELLLPIHSNVGIGLSFDNGKPVLMKLTKFMGHEPDSVRSINSTFSACAKKYEKDLLRWGYSKEVLNAWIGTAPVKGEDGKKATKRPFARREGNQEQILLPPIPGLLSDLGLLHPQTLKKKNFTG